MILLFESNVSDGDICRNGGKRREAEGSEFILLCILFFDLFRSVCLSILYHFFWPVLFFCLLRRERNDGPFQISWGTLEAATSIV